MTDFIMIPAIFGIVTYGIYSLFELFARRKERLAIIEKLNTGEFRGELKLGKIEFQSKFTALKWACLFIGIGLGLMIGYILGLYTLPVTKDLSWNQKELLGVIYGASALFCGGLAMLAAFLIEYNLSKRDK